jgi:hypothetical protein
LDYFRTKYGEKGVVVVEGSKATLPSERAVNAERSKTNEMDKTRKFLGGPPTKSKKKNGTQ